MLNSNLVFNFMSAYSNAFVLAKERGTFQIKKAMAAAEQGEAKKAAEQELAAPIADIADDTKTGQPKLYPVSDYEKRLLLGLLERLYTFCHERDIALVIQVIPTGGMLREGEAPDRPFVDLFPYDEFDAARPGLAVVPMIDELAPHSGSGSGHEDDFVFESRGHGYFLLHSPESTRALCRETIRNRSAKSLSKTAFVGSAEEV